MAQSNDKSFNEDSQYCNWREKRLYLDYHSNHLPITAGWRYDSIYSDEFESTNLSTKWNAYHKKWDGKNTHVGYINSQQNICIKNGKLYLIVTENVTNISCYCSWNTVGSHYIVPELLSGWLMYSDKIRYGYFETECYLPKNHNYWPCFWLYRRDDAINDYDEVDVFERTKADGTDQPNIIRQNCYNKNGYPDYSKTTQILTFPDSISGTVSVFGVEILPKEVVFYINGHVSSHLQYNENLSAFNSWNTYTCTDVEEMIPMHMLLTLTCDPTQISLPLPHDSAWFEYTRCYKLERGSMDTYHPTTFAPSNESTKVYPHVVLGGTGCTAQINTSTAIWAEQDIILDKGFELSANTAFSARVISVPDPMNSELYKHNSHQ